MKLILRVPTDTGPRTAVIVCDDLGLARGLSDAVLGAGGDTQLCDDSRGYSFIAHFRKRAAAKERADRKAQAPATTDATILPMRGRAKK